ncbi:MAG TPA: GrpB family protein [Thermomicrobiales bacterium]|nr:GrpB family protein [Thermomicrobiales bacterium]
MRMEIVQPPSQTDWAAAFEAERALLAEHAGEFFTRIDHIGSTAVPGLPAKPIIDLQAQVEALDEPEFYAELLGPLGYRLVDADEVDVRVPLRKRQGRDANIHIVRAGSWAAQRTLIFRDALRADPELSAQYARLKRELGASSETRLVYTLAKTEFIEDTLRDCCQRLEIAYTPGNRR